MGSEEEYNSRLLNWYKTTDSYIYELSSYHDDPGFNYMGMCGGIAERLKAEGCGSALCLGDGIGDLTIVLLNAGIKAVYHDLAGSKTAQFAEFRIKNAGYEFPSDMTEGWEPAFAGTYDAIVSLDFLEHVTDVPAWCRAIHAALKPGGLFCAQNAFDCGSGNDGAIPCHLSINDKYAHAAPHTEGAALWDHLLVKEIGFRQISSNWYERPA